MPKQELELQLKELLLQNDWFLSILKAIRTCSPPDWLVGGGVIRNIIWDHLHGYRLPTLIKDVDVVFFDPTNVSSEYENAIQTQLYEILPDVPWEVKNQAAVHLWYERVFGYPVEPLVSSADAIGTWPEPATCVAVRLLENDDLLVVAPYGLDDLFHMVLRRNPRRVTEQIFLDRLQSKKPLEKWPNATIQYENKS